MKNHMSTLFSSERPRKKRSKFVAHIAFVASLAHNTKTLTLTQSLSLSLEVRQREIKRNRAQKKEKQRRDATDGENEEATHKESDSLLQSLEEEFMMSISQKK